MGLDIIYYRNLREVPREEFDSLDANHLLVVAVGFKDRISPLKTIPGFYAGERVKRFRAGSYTGYNEWRNSLTRMALGVTANEVWAHHEAFKDKPFYELINFSDCSGTLGSDVCRKLYADFCNFDAKASSFPDDGYFYEKYKEWKEAFRVASENGAVEFC